MILVTGGLGYIGSHCVIKLEKLGYEVVIVDLLTDEGQEKRDKMEKILNKKLKVYFGNICEDQIMDRIFRTEKITLIIHCAAFKSVGQSMTEPVKYYDNNVGGLIKLCQKMVEYKISKIIFSSTAVVYADSNQILKETNRLDPPNVYGQTKRMGEIILNDMFKRYNWDITIFRYFNVIGCEDSGQLKDTSPTNLCSVIAQVISGQLKYLPIYGNDYPTKDGTCIRDYISINDLIEAHIKVLSASGFSIYNLGSNYGYTVLDIVAAFNRHLPQPLVIKFVDRRPGDPAILIADSHKAQQELHWSAQEDLNTTIRSLL